MVLIGYWPLNETTGSTAYDHSGKENHGTVNNGGDSTVIGNATAPTGQNAYSFDGNNDDIDLGLNLNNYTNASGPLSISLWAYLKTDAPSNSINENALLQTDSGMIGYWLWNSGGGNEVQAYLYDGSQRYVPISYNKNQWIHITLTFSNGKLKGYKNGRLVGSDSTNQIHTINEGVFIGSEGGHRYFNAGNLCEVRIYNHALSPQEVQYLYTVGKQGRLTSGRKRS